MSIHGLKYRTAKQDRTANNDVSNLHSLVQWQKKHTGIKKDVDEKVADESYSKNQNISLIFQNAVFKILGKSMQELFRILAIKTRSMENN